MPKYARVLVDQSGSQAFDYEIPELLTVEVGSRVRVPVRARMALATVIELMDASDVPNVKPIDRVLGERPALSPLLIRLAHWIADYYCCPVEVAMRSVLPQVIRDAEVGFKTQRFARLAGPVPPETLESLQRRAPKQAAVLQRLIQAEGSIPAAELAKDSSHQTLNSMRQRGLILLESQAVERDPHKNEVFLPAPKLKLNEEQSAVFEVVLKTIAEPKVPILLHGVTGSGKTEIYLQAIEQVLSQGRTAIMLVPEISLTPQTVERFKSRFSTLQNSVAVLHSHLSQGERHDEWHKINDGRARIVIGARSAIFAPMENLGLIVVDEEHENSYKQEEAPRYHGRDIAVLRGKMEGCAVILGSATPSLESYQNAATGKYQLVRLSQRVDDQKMPLIRIIDMRQERTKGQSLISEKLRQAIAKRLERKEQSILFLNRRGFSTSLVCSVCGHVCQCPNCSISLTFHRSAAKLVCHCCGHIAGVPAKCPGCGDPKIRYAGAGTEKVEEVVARIFPNAVVERMDADAMSRKEAYRERLHAFRTGKIDILVGTQMIAKGLHFPNVTLVGIINADSALHLPDFRAGERTFQLLTQVAGRAGRGDVEGEVFVQSHTPFHPSIQFARHHDFEGFCTQEIEFREKWGYPPFTHMVLITIRSPHEAKAKFSAETLARRLKEVLPPETILSEPAPAPVEKSHGNFRFHLMLRTKAVVRLSRSLSGVLSKLTFPEEVIVTTDIDAYQLL